MTPSQKQEGGKQEELKEKMQQMQRSKEELRELWKRSIHQAILLIRMEKENAKIKGLYSNVFFSFMSNLFSFFK